MDEQFRESQRFRRLAHSKILAGAFGLYLLLHLIYFLLPSIPYANDSLSYYQWAQDNVRTGSVYPSQLNTRLQEEGVVAPVYINAEVLVLSIWNDPKAIFLLNALLNIGQCVLVCLLADVLFGEQSAVVAGCLYMLYLNNLGLVLSNYTELAFGFVVLLSAYLYFTRRSALGLLGAGFVLGLAIGIRPTAIAAIVAFVLVGAWDFFRKRWNWRNPLLVCVGLGIYIVLAGTYANHSIDDFVFMSTTGPANLLVGANDISGGKFNDEIFKDPQFVKSTYKERNKAYQEYAVRWIKNHPFLWLATIPQKIYSTYITDDFTVSQLLLNPDWTLNRYIKELRSRDTSQFGRETFTYRAAFLTLNMYHQIFYVFLVLLFLLNTVTKIRQRLFSREEALLYLFIATGFLMTVIGTIGSLRYKYNFVIVAIILCSPYLLHHLTARFTKQIADDAA